MMLKAKSSLWSRIVLVLTFSLTLGYYSTESTFGCYLTESTFGFAHWSEAARSKRVRSSAEVESSVPDLYDLSGLHNVAVASQAMLSQAVLRAVASQAATGVNGKIAFTSERDGNYEIYSMNPDGSGQVNLTNAPGPDVTPAWSFDGKKITFASARDLFTSGFYVPRDIFIMDADGSHVQNLTQTDSIYDLRLYDPSWSPAGNKIILVNNFLGELSNLRIITVDGSSSIGFDSNTEVVAPAWSPDGTRLAFIARRGGQIQDPLRFYLYVINADGSGKTRLTLDLPAFFFRVAVLSGPTWSPDGTKIAFANYRDGNAEIYVIDAGGGNPQRLTTNSAADLFPCWSPDGTQIAFATNRDGNFEIYAMNADGSHPTRLTSNDADDYDPVWQTLSNSTMVPPVQPTMQMSSPTFRVSEPGYEFGPGDEITVTRLGDLSGAQTVDYVTSDGTARSGSNYRTTAGSIHFAPGEGSQIIPSPVLHNGVIEGDRYFNITLLNPAGATLGGSMTAVVTITDADIPIPGRNALDDPQFFVRQQYRDFLNRNPDAVGLAYWTSQITQCNGDPVCAHNQRIDVAAAFFISQEFQQSGFFLHGFYKASLGRRPAFLEFTTDHNQVVGGSNLESSKIAFANAFVQRAEFLSRYPEGLDGPAFINALVEGLVS